MFKAISQLIYFTKPVNTLQYFRKDSFRMFHQTSKRNFCAESNPVVKAVITKALTYCSSFNDLFHCYDKYHRAFDLTHLSIILNKFNYLQRNIPKNPRLEAHYNEILSLVVYKFERGEDQGDNRILTLFYQFVSQGPYDGPITKRCNFILEQKGIAQYQGMKQSELAGFITTLALNNKKAYIRSLIPHLSGNIHQQPKEKIARILYEISRFNLHAPELASNIEKYCLRSHLIERLEPREFAKIFYFFSGYPDIKNPYFFKKFEERLVSIAGAIDEKSFSMIVEAADNYQWFLISSKIYKTLESKFFAYLGVLDNKIITSYFSSYCLRKLDNTALYQRVCAHVLRNSDKFDISFLAKIFFWSTERRKLDLNSLKQFTEIFMKYGIDRLKLNDFEMIFPCYNHYYRATRIKPSNETLEDLYLFLKERLDSFSFHQFQRIIEHIPILSLEDQQEIYLGLQKRVIKDSDQIKNEDDYEFIYKLVQFSFEKCQDSTSQDFIHTVIDLTGNIARTELENPSQKRSINTLEKLAKLIHLLADKSITTEYKEKLGNLFRTLEELFIQSYQSYSEIDGNLTESKLFIYIMAFYSLIDKPSPEIGKLLQKALSVFDMKKLSPANIKFLFEKTDLIDESRRAWISANTTSPI